MDEAVIAQGPVDVIVSLPCDEPCPKCGSKDIHRHFIAKGSRVPHEGYDKCASRYGTGQCHYWTATRDHLHNHCRCCQFAWQSLPIKRKKATANAGA